MLEETFQISNTRGIRIENIVKEGCLHDNTEAVNETPRLHIRRYKAIKIGKDIDKLRVKAGRDINLTEEVMKTHEEEDELWSASAASVVVKWFKSLRKAAHSDRSIRMSDTV